MTQKTKTPRPTPPDATRPLRAHALEDLMQGAAQLLLPFMDRSRWRAPPHQRPNQIQLRDGRPIDFTLVRRRRRTIGFTIDARGLTVSAPHWVARAAIDQALDEKRDWISRKLDEWQAFEARRAALAQAWRNGGEIRYLGRPCRLWQIAARSAPRFEPGDDHDELHLPSAGDDLRAPAERWLRERARELLGGRVVHFARASGLQPSDWRLSNARTQWGSCTASGVVRLNWRLIQLPPELIDYVVAHELAHLKELNHGPRFWATVERILPGHAHARRRLRDMPEHLAH
ncbi:MAG: SprT family zinc-dependent metalloprotease [Burkholderiaceae bacterium]